MSARPYATNKGFSMVEMLVVALVGMMVLNTAVVVYVMSKQFAVNGIKSSEAFATIEWLASEFQSDLVQTVEVLPHEGDFRSGPATLILARSDGTTKVYQYAQEKLRILTFEQGVLASTRSVSEKFSSLEFLYGRDEGGRVRLVTLKLKRHDPRRLMTKIPELKFKAYVRAGQ